LTLHSIIFSNNIKYKLSRHFLFWIAWILYYAGLGSLSGPEKGPFINKFIVFLTEILLSLPVHMAFCYFIIYFLIPRYLNKGRYVSMVLLWLLSSLICIAVLRLFHGYMAPAVRRSFGFPTTVLPQNIFAVILDYFADFNMQGCLAASIKLGKMWYVKQQELLLLHKEKDKMQFRHSLDEDTKSFFLGNFFYNIIPAFNKNGSLSTGTAKISDLLLYMSSIGNQSRLKLKDELAALTDYLEIENSLLSGKCQIELKTEGDIEEQQIAPLIVLPLVDGSLGKLKQLQLTDKKLRIDIRVKKSEFLMRILFNKPPDSSVLEGNGKDYLQNITERLELIYPQSFNFTITVTEEHFMNELSIDLSSAIS